MDDCQMCGSPMGDMNNEIDVVRFVEVTTDYVHGFTARHSSGIVGRGAEDMPVWWLLPCPPGTSETARRIIEVEMGRRFPNWHVEVIVAGAARHDHVHEFYIQDPPIRHL